MLIRVRLLRVCLLATVGLAGLAACSDDSDDRVDPKQVDAVEEPELGACRMLEPADVAEAIVHVLAMPPGSVVAEIAILPMGETSWP